MKRFMLFVGSNFYPSPGMEDFRSSFDDMAEACLEGDKLVNLETEDDWYQVYDLTEEQIVARGKYKYDRNTARQ